MKTAPQWEKDGYTLMLSRDEDLDSYLPNFFPLDEEAARLTGSPTQWDREVVANFFLKCVDDLKRYDFLLHAPDGKIVGECVINEIEWEEKWANLRIVIFSPEHRNHGLGQFMVERAVEFAFDELKLDYLELDVFNFNPRARHVYEQVGFRVREVHADTHEVTMWLFREKWEA